MRLRPFVPDTDFEAVKSWIADERSHAMWCAGRFAYPPEKEDFLRVLREIRSGSGDAPFVMTADGEKAVGFFCCSLRPSAGESTLKFVVVDPALRGKGAGKAMLRLAAEYVFSVTDAEAVRLAVFRENIPALKCYERTGFAVRKTDAGAFRFRDESWSRCSMAVSRKAFGECGAGIKLREG